MLVIQWALPPYLFAASCGEVGWEQVFVLFCMPFFCYFRVCGDEIVKSDKHLLPWADWASIAALRSFAYRCFPLMGTVFRAFPPKLFVALMINFGGWKTLILFWVPLLCNRWMFALQIVETLKYFIPWAEWATTSIRSMRNSRFPFMIWMDFAFSPYFVIAGCFKVNWRKFTVFIGVPLF